jgi:hypothetical protein
MGLIQVSPPVAEISLYRRNVIINGNMAIATRGAGPITVTSSAVYAADRFYSTILSDGSATLTRVLSGPANSPFIYSLEFKVTSADTSLGATQNAYINQRIEGHYGIRLVGKPVTLSFWVKSTKTGTYSATLTKGMEGSDTRTIIRPYTINNADTWEFKTVTFPALDPSTIGGTWGFENATLITIQFGLAWGSDYTTSNEGWNTTGKYGHTNQVNLLDTVNATFNLTGVQLEAGIFATPFDHLPFSTNLQDCERYYELVSMGYAGCTMISTTSGYVYKAYRTLKRSTPTVVFLASSPAQLYFSGAWYNCTSTTITPLPGYVIVVCADTGHTYAVAGSYVSVGTLEVNAELAWGT